LFVHYNFFFQKFGKMISLAILLITTLTRFVKGDDFEYKLIDNLMANYNKYARPTKNYSQTTNVTFGKYIFLNYLI
jgi:hypothetical protein